MQASTSLRSCKKIIEDDKPVDWQRLLEVSSAFGEAKAGGTPIEAIVATLGSSIMTADVTSAHTSSLWPTTVTTVLSDISGDEKEIAEMIINAIANQPAKGGA